MINRFDGEYYFLSNFYPVSVEYQGITYKNSEAAFHAQKVFDEKTKLEFSKLNAGEAKRKGRKVPLRKDWNGVKVGIMKEIVLAKFTQHEDLKEKLLATGNEELVEGTKWHDTFWGIDEKTGKGENHLGIILMEIREELREDIK